MRTYSKITKAVYEPEQCVFITNVKQAALYLKNGAFLCDILWAQDSLIFVFKKKDTKAMYELWCKRELT